MILRATHSHLYPGHRGTIAGLARLSDLPADGAGVIEFSDGSTTLANITRSDDGWRLDTDAYRTMAGTRIAAKRWKLALDANDGRLQFRIIEKMPWPPAE